MTRTRHPLSAALLAATLLAAAGCAGDPSPVAPPALVPDLQEGPDSAPPAVPSGLAAAATGGVVKLAWLPNTTDPDLLGFLVYRQAFGQSLPLTEAPLAGTTFIDARPLSGPCQYAVTSVDVAGNESGWALVFCSPLPELPQRQAD